ncbi:hypothetical protein [Francisella sp. LA112445]|uniref:hypothetical protein n=1 Tax=Francisella sp. LA112445 TaxID=1395624 RepID=UPI001788AF0D|nr:hypothetical protein [Francisella sp. LA112445]QIW09683.1 hypothetical protein FIP56_02920 [Francisella sp. LA112445]
MYSQFKNISATDIDFDDLKPDQLEELKSLFNYCSPKSIEELRFAQLYDKWFATKQIGKYFVNGRLQVSLTPLNDDLSLNTENIKYLHTNQIQDLKLDLELYGFNGELLFNIPYSFEEESLWSDLSNYQNKFLIEIKYQESLNEQTNQQNCWAVKGYVDLTKNNAIELTDQISNIDDSVAPIHYLSCRLCFVDAFAFIAKQHYPVKVYPQSSYVTVFDDIFKSFNSILNIDNISIAKSVSVLDNSYNWICVNCDYPKRSFYDFFFYTLKHYQLQFVYNYSSTEPSYSIVDLAAPSSSEKTSVTFSTEIIKSIIKQIGSYSFSNVNLINHHWIDQDTSSTTNLNTDNQSISVSKDYIFKYPVPSSQLDSAQNYFTNEINYAEKKLKTISFEWLCFPQQFTAQPQSKFVLPEQYQQSLPQYTGEMMIYSSKISFKNYNRIPLYAGQASEYVVCAASEDISSIDYQLYHGINIFTDVCSSSELVLSFPNYEQSAHNLNIYGWIDSLVTGTDTIYSVVSANETDSQQDINKDFTTEKTAFLMHDHSCQELSYVVRLPSNLNGSSSSAYITLPYFILDDHAVRPLRRGTPVSISLSQENGHIKKIMWHSMLDQTFDKNSQINKMTFGANDSAGVIHQAENQKLTEGSLEIFSETSNNKTQLISDKTQMSLIYSEE